MNFGLPEYLPCLIDKISHPEGAHTLSVDLLIKPVFLLEFLVFRRSFTDLVAKIVENFCSVFPARDIGDVMLRRSDLKLGLGITLNKIDNGRPVGEVGAIAW